MIFCLHGLRNHYFPEEIIRLIVEETTGAPVNHIKETEDSCKEDRLDQVIDIQTAEVETEEDGVTTMVAEDRNMVIETIIETTKEDRLIRVEMEDIKKRSGHD